MVYQALCRHPARGPADAAARCRVSHRRILQDRLRPPVSPGATDPLDATTGQCQLNFHLLATDGYWNQPLSLGTVGNQDRTVPSLPGPITGFTHGKPLSAPLSRGADGRQQQPRRSRDEVLDHRSPRPARQGARHGCPVAARDALRGVDRRRRKYPVPRWRRCDYGRHRGLAEQSERPGLGGPEAIDDLWHASLNSRGKFFNAANPQDLAKSIVSALNDFVGAQWHRHGRRDRRRATVGHQHLRLPDELRFHRGR